MPQLWFNEDFAPEGGTGLKAGPWLPFLNLCSVDCLSDHRVDRPRPTKSAGKPSAPTSSRPWMAGGGPASTRALPGMNKSLTASAAPVSGSADAAEGDDDVSSLPPQKKARHNKAGGFI